MSRLLRYLSCLFMLFFAGNALATSAFPTGSYDCPTYKMYNDCSLTYYVSDCPTSPDEWNGQQVSTSDLTPENSCIECPENYVCDGGLTCPEPKAVFVTYDLNGGSGTTPGVTACQWNRNCNLASGDTNSFYRAGYVFKGWYGTPDGTEDQAIMSLVMPGDIKMYAVWVPCGISEYKTSSANASAACSACPAVTDGFEYSGSTGKTSATSCSQIATDVTELDSNCSGSSAAGANMVILQRGNEAGTGWGQFSIMQDILANPGSYVTVQKDYTSSESFDWNNLCVPCGANSNSSGGLTLSCTCDNGYTVDGTIDGETTTEGGSCSAIGVTCDAKTYLPKGTTACVACPAGSYCEGGTYYFNESLDQGITGKCPAGYTSNLGQAAKNTDCYITIEDGKYLGTPNGTEATNCVAGTYKTSHTVNYGQTSECTVCETNTYSDEGASACLACSTETGYTNSGSSASSHAGESSCKTTCSSGEYVRVAYEACVSVGNGYWKGAHTVRQGSTSTRNQCPEDYRDGLPAGTEEDCVGTFEKSGLQENGSVPANCASVTGWGTCEPGTCSYKQNYGGEITEDCTPENCTKPVLSVTANAGYYDNGTTCPACSTIADKTFTLSEQGNEGGNNQCYKECSLNCTQQACPENAQCTHGNQVTYGTHYYGSTCSAAPSTCTLEFTCNKGYKKNQDGTACEAETYTITYNSNNKQSETEQQQVTYKAKFTTKPATTFVYPGYKFTSWGGNYPLANSEYTYNDTANTELTAQWTACSAAPTAPGTCDCPESQYPNGSGCSACTLSCSSVSGFTYGTYNVCESQTDSICYRNCTKSDIPNSSEVTGTVTKGGTKTCKATACANNYYLSDGACAACVPNATCPGGDETFQCNPGFHLSSDGKSCERDVYSITLKKNGGTGTINGSTGTSDAVQQCQHGVMCNLPASGLERTGFSFTGWGDSQDCESGVLQKTFTSAATMYACWSQSTTKCELGKYYNGSEHIQCPEGMFCNGNGSSNIGTPGCGTPCPGGGTSEVGASSQNQCYVSCSGKSITGGNLTADAEKSYYTGSEYPTCTYTANCNVGYIASGNNTAFATCEKCEDGVTCPGGTEEGEPAPCPEGSYCEEGIETPCPDGGTSEMGATSVELCYKPCAPTLDIDNGQGVSTGNAYYNGASYPACQYEAQCDENYIAQNSPSENPSCVWEDSDACPAGFYCPPDSPSPISCPDGGTSEVGSVSVTQCYKIFDDYEEFKNGVASAKCFYQSSTSLYDACTIIEVKSCIAGYWYATQNAFLCSGTTSGYYSPENDISQTKCPDDPYGSDVKSNEYAKSYADCYKTCQIDVEHSTSVAAKETTVNAISEDEYAACSFAVTCETGYTVNANNTETPSCVANEYTITLNKNGGTGSTPDSVQCTFDSGSCNLPATDGLSRTGYTVQNKWCSDQAGNGPCYYAGQSTAANISANGTDITLYAVWTPNVYEVNLDHQGADTNGEPETVYVKYATGWFTNQDATNGITKLTTIPTKYGYDFAGYYSTASGGTQIISSDGKFQTSENALSFTSTAPATIYARWSEGMTYCAPGTYYSGTETQCNQCTENHYCSGGYYVTGSGVAEGLYACPENGLSESGNDSITNCYKTGLNYTATHGTGTQTCNYNDSAKSYTSGCTDKVIDLCEAGYYLSDASDDNPDCSPVGNGYYSGGDSTERVQCPNGGDTETQTATIVQQCFKTGLSYNATYGSGTQRCFYSSGDGASAVYQRECDTKEINSCRGGYWLENPDDTDCVPVQNNYYSETGDTERHECPGGGKTNEATSESIVQCYKDGLPYTEAEHGKGEYLCYYTSGEGNDAIYSSGCLTPTMTSCDPGYYSDHQILPTDCMPVGNGYYSPDTDIKRYLCPLNGTTETTTSASAQDCYREDMLCYIENGNGKQTCNYNESDGNYTLNCQTCYVTSCEEGYSLVDNACITCPADNVCNEGVQETCYDLTSGSHPNADAGTTDVSMCYTDCALAQNAATMTGRDYYGIADTCKIQRCEAGFTLQNGVCEECPEGSFCDGTTDPTEPGDDIKSCADLGNGDWELSLPGATDASGCYKQCKPYDVINGTAVPVNEKAFYPADCEYEGRSESGNPCEIIDGVCVETACAPGFEMKDGVCVPCDREYALSYTTGGVCQIAECVLNYHPNGDKCEYNVQECSVPNAVYAEKTWNFDKNAFGVCTVKECDYGYHISSNACVSDVQPCNVKNGTGFKEWNHDRNTWGECIAVTCNPGYTNDPSETNEKTEQCGECKNKYSVLGKLAASSYIQGCEIASCMYQGELYNLEYNECVPICPMEEYEDETGTMVWDESRKKCVRTCKEGYTMW